MAQLRQRINSWLGSLGLCPPDQNTRPLEEDPLWQVGRSFASLFISISSSIMLSETTTESLLKLKLTNTLPVRLFNWNILAKAFQEVGIGLSVQTKKQIIDGNYNSIFQLVQSVYSLSTGELTTNQQDLETSVVKLQLLEKTGAQYESITGFLVGTLSDSMGLSKENSIHLLQDDNRLLDHMLRAGNTHFTGMTSFLGCIQNKVEEIAHLIQSGKDANVFCNTLKQGLLSEQDAIFQSCVLIIRNAFYMSQAVRGWLKHYGLVFTIRAGLDQRQRAGKIVGLLYTVLGQLIFSLTSPDSIGKLNLELGQELLVISMLLESLPQQGLTHYIQSAEFQLWIDLLMDNMKFMRNTHQTMHTVNTFWACSPVLFSSHKAELPLAYVQFLKQTTMSKSVLNSTTAITSLFSLLDKLALQKSLYAPHVFRVICSILQVMEVDDKLLFVLDNLVRSYQSIPSLPIKQVIPTLLRVAQIAPSVQTLDLLVNLAKEDELDFEHKQLFFRLLVKLNLSKVHFGSYVQAIITQLVSLGGSFQVDGLALQALILSLSLFYQIVSTNPHLMTAKNKRQVQSQQLQQVQSTTKMVRIYQMIQLLLEQFPQAQSTMSLCICQTIHSLRPVGNGQNVLLMKLLRMSNNQTSINEMLEDEALAQEGQHPEQRFHQMNQLEESVEQDSPSVEEEHSVQEMSQEFLQSQIQDGFMDIKDSPAVDYPQTIMTIGEKSDHTSPNNRGNSIARSQLDVLNVYPITPNGTGNIRLGTKRSSISISIKPPVAVLQSIQDIRTRRLLRLKTQQEKQKDHFLHQEQKNQRAKRVVQRRMVQFGVSQHKDQQTVCVLAWNSLKQTSVVDLGLTDIQLVDWQYQEDQFIQGVGSIMRKYKKLWRFLFSKFSTSEKEANSSNRGEESISVSEIWKLLRYYDLFIPRREQMNTFVRQVNESRGQRAHLHSLTLGNFEQFVVQYAVYSSHSRGTGCPSLHLCILKLIQQMRTAAFIKGDHVGLFENPQKVYLHQGEVIEEFNRRLEQDPQYILPEGYKRVTQTEVTFKCRILPTNVLALKEPLLVACWVLSQLLEDLLGTTFIEPSICREDVHFAKPVLFQNLGQKLRENSKGYMQPQKRRSETLQIERIRHIDKTSFRPLIRFSLGIKLGVSFVSIKNKFIAEEVAYLMNDILDTIDAGKTTVANLGKVQIVNARMKQIGAQKEEDRKKESIKTQKHNKRIESIKSTLMRQKQLATNARLQQLKSLTLEAQSQKSRQKSEQRRYDTIKEKIKRKKIQDQESTKMQRQMEERLRKVRQRGRYQSLKELISREKEELAQLQSDTKRKNEQQFRKIEEDNIQDSKKQARLYLDNLKKDEHLLQKVVTTKDLYSSSWVSSGIQSVSRGHEGQLTLLFQLLLKYQNSSLSSQMSKQISFQTFNHFCLKFRVVPNLIDKSEATPVFRSLVKQTVGTQGLDFKLFQEALFRICVRAKEVLNSPDMNATVKDQTREYKLIRGRQRVSMVDQYLFDASLVTERTFGSLYEYLNLPSDKMGMQIRYRKALESS